MSIPSCFKIKIFADGADLENILALAKNPLISGYTTNPTLMRKAGIKDYVEFAKKVLEHITTEPVSFEVFADEFGEMERQAREIASWGENVYVKVPITNTKAESSFELIRQLSAEGIKLNVTAIMTIPQIEGLVEVLDPGTPAVVSVFAGRIADTGRDPIPVMSRSIEILKSKRLAEVLWASPREVLNIFQADEVGCHIITVTPDLIKKLDSAGKSLEDFSLETVKMFFGDALSAGYSIPLRGR